MNKQWLQMPLLTINHALTTTTDIVTVINQTITTTIERVKLTDVSHVNRDVPLKTDINGVTTVDTETDGLKGTTLVEEIVITKQTTTTEGTMMDVGQNATEVHVRTTDFTEATTPTKMVGKVVTVAVEKTTTVKLLKHKQSGLCTLLA